MRFKDRYDAGRVLAKTLYAYQDNANALVLALPRGGVPVAYEVARALNLPLDVFLVRKLGVPENEELAMGAIASGDVRVLNEGLMRHLELPEEVIERRTKREWEKLAHRENFYRKNRPGPVIAHRTIILIDDGLATGASMRAAIVALRQRKPRKIIVAVPVASPSACAELQQEVDEIVCAATPEPFHSVGYWYDHFAQIDDNQVRELLEKRRITTVFGDKLFARGYTNRCE